MTTYGYIGRLGDMLEGVDQSDVNELADYIKYARDNGKRIWLCGNGGSAATANHFAEDLSCVASRFGKPIRALSLCANQSVITCIANDNGYQYIFRKQLETQMDEGDIVIGISASGNSQNVIHALQYAANSIKCGVPLAMVGFDGGIMKRISAHCIHVPSFGGEYGAVEDAHMIICHSIIEELKRENAA